MLIDHWRDIAHFFVGFKVDWKGQELTIGRAGKTHFFPKELGLSVPYNECKLIARSINDMTPKEWVEYNGQSFNPMLLDEDLSLERRGNIIKSHATIWFKLGCSFEDAVWFLPRQILPPGIETTDIKIK